MGGLELEGRVIELPSGERLLLSRQGGPPRLCRLSLSPCPLARRVGSFPEPIHRQQLSLWWVELQLSLSQPLIGSSDFSLSLSPSLPRGMLNAVVLKPSEGPSESL